MSIKNLLKLATYLESLPENYEHFEMRDYLDGGDPTKYQTYALTNGGPMKTCGAAACAVGHGPSAGFLFLPEELMEDHIYNESLHEYVDFLNPDWHQYAARVFCDSEEYEDEYRYMFGGYWSRSDNTPWGAAARIRLICAEGEAPRDEFGYEDNSPQRYASYHKKNRPAPTLWQRVVAKLKG
jgi:hypothetical protein